MQNKWAELERRLVELRGELGKDQPQFWPFMDRAASGTLSKTDANKFALYAMLDFQMKPAPQAALARVTRLIDDLGDPNDLWRAILAIPDREWAERRGPRSLHRFTKRHTKVRQFARIMIDTFAGDARLIWAERDSARAFSNFDCVLGIGPMMARHAVLGLLESGLVVGTGRAKADVHLMRVLGRVTRSTEFRQNELDAFDDQLQQVKPAESWRLDYPLFRVGQKWCNKTAPQCGHCPLQNLCKFFAQRTNQQTIGSQ